MASLGSECIQPLLPSANCLNRPCCREHRLRYGEKCSVSPPDFFYTIIARAEAPRVELGVLFCHINISDMYNRGTFLKHKRLYVYIGPLYHLAGGGGITILYNWISVWSVIHTSTKSYTFILNILEPFRKRLCEARLAIHEKHSHNGDGLMNYGPVNYGPVV